MFRRNFIQRITLGTASGLAALGTADAGESRTVTYRIKGFTCVTCAVGLDTLLKQEKGVISSHSSYPEARSVIMFDPSLVTENSLKSVIAEMGFSVIEEPKR